MFFSASKAHREELEGILHIFEVIILIEMYREISWMLVVTYVTLNKKIRTYLLYVTSVSVN